MRKSPTVAFPRTSIHSPACGRYSSSPTTTAKSSEETRIAGTLRAFVPFISPPVACRWLPRLDLRHGARRLQDHLHHREGPLAGQPPVMHQERLDAGRLTG